MLEAQPLHGIVKFDVHAEIVGIQLEFIAVEQPGVRIHIHDQRRYRPVAFDAPMPITARLGLEVDAGHGPSGPCAATNETTCCKTTSGAVRCGACAAPSISAVVTGPPAR